jgi:mannose-6-phosphate isomerase
MERVWGGRRLAELFGKPLPPGAPIGESWEVVDRPEAQSVVSQGRFAGASLNDLWTTQRELFGERAIDAGDRFPLLVKLLDCAQTLSVQVHPPADVAARLGGEPKTELWVVLHAPPGSCIYAGLRAGVGRAEFEQALRRGEDVSLLLHRIPVTAGDVMFLPAGRIHAIGAGCVIAEVQQSSDTTYRVYDFNRPGLDGKPRELHVEQSLKAIDWDDAEPGLLRPEGESLVRDSAFEADRLELRDSREVAAGDCAVACVLEGEVRCGDERFGPGVVFLVPAGGEPVSPVGASARILRVRLGSR